MVKAVQDREVSTAQLMRRKFPSVRSSERAIHARKLILESGTPVIPVLNDDGRYLGAVTRGALLKALVDFHMYVPERHQKARIRQLSISNVMKVDYPSIGEESTLGDVVRKILAEQCPGVVVVNGLTPVGIVSTDEILSFIVNTFPEEQ